MMSDSSFCPESELIEHAQRGDAGAFTALYHTHKRRIHGLCYRMTHNRELAEELTQETFVQIFRKLNTYRGDAAFSTWLYRVAVNVVLMALRRGCKHDDEVPLEDDTSDELGLRSPLQRLAREDDHLMVSLDRIGLQRAVAELPAGYGIVFVLHDVYGYRHSDIAELLGCSVGNTKSQLHKARLRLRRRLLGKPEVRRRRKAAQIAA